MNDSEKLTKIKPNMLNNLSLVSSRVKMLKDMTLILEGRYNDPEDNIDEHCREIFTTLSSVKDSVEIIRNYLKEQMEQTNSLTEHVRSLRELKEHICHMKNQLPEELVSTAEINYSIADSNGFTSVNYYDVSPVPPSWSQLDSPLVNFRDKPVTNRGKETVKKNQNIPLIPYVTDVEMNTVPKYMRGRLTAIVINKLIESFNEVYKKKYELIGKPKKTIKPKDLDYYCDWKRDENLEPKGTFFITVKDINTFGNMKMDKAAFNIVTILRHLKRIRETRHNNGQGLYMEQLLPKGGNYCILQRENHQYFFSRFS